MCSLEGLHEKNTLVKTMINNKKFAGIVLFLFLGLGIQNTLAQIVQETEQDAWSSELDSLREIEEMGEDTIIYSAKFVRFTTLDRMEKGTYTVPLDTTLNLFRYFNPQNNPYNPSINLGSYGLPSRDLLFQPPKTIGFQTGYHSLERYLFQSDSTRYYRNRAPYSELSFVTGDQVFTASVAQNVSPHWSIGGEIEYALSNGFYQNQRYNNTKARLHSWYESENHRYNLLTNLVFNTLVATENGSVVNDTLFRDPERGPSESEYVKLRNPRDERPRQTWVDHSFFLRQSYFMGRIDTLNADSLNEQILPTNSIFHSLRLRTQKFKFYKNEEDAYAVFPFGQYTLTNDSTRIQTISNEFGYDFYLRGKSVSFVKNEVKLDLRLRNDLYFYDEMGDKKTFQNTTLKAGVGYRFSDRVNVQGNFNQIVAGKHIGDFLYEANARITFGEQVGNIVLGAYSQNKSPEYLYEHVKYQYHQWDHSFDKTKINNLSFAYENPKLGFYGKAEYFLINNHLYFQELPNPENNPRLTNQIEPVQSTANINMLKITLGQKFRFGHFHFDNFGVYQKSDYMDLLQVPELYSWHSLYYNNILVKVINLNVGFDVKFHTPFATPSYAINISQFYKDNANIEFSTYPIVDVWLTATLKRTNFSLSYNFVNQHLYPDGYYTVRRYPMANAHLRFGVSWKFYD